MRGLDVAGDELGADSYPLKLVDGLYYELEGKSIQIKNGIDESLIGGNASENPEEEDKGDGADDGAVSGINVVLAHKLVETSFDKASYTAYIKGYMKSVKEHLEKNNPDRVEAFTKGMPAVVKMILGNFSNWQFFQGEGMNPDSMVILMNYREDGVTPYFIIFKDGIREEKV